MVSPVGALLASSFIIFTVESTNLVLAGTVKWIVTVVRVFTKIAFGLIES
jgi:hypothetical protein